MNNLLSPVRFADALREVPARALLVEVAPHALLQAVLKRALPGAAHVPLVRRDAACALQHLLAAAGRLFAAGAQPAVGALYPAVPFPVPRGTPGLASHVRWDHSLEWSVAHFGNASRSGENVIEYDVSRPDDGFITGHNIDGRVLFPATGYLVSARLLIFRRATCFVQSRPCLIKLTIRHMSKKVFLTKMVLASTSESRAIFCAFPFYAQSNKHTTHD